MELFTTIEAAQQIGIGDAYLRNLISDGKAHPTKMIGGTWMFDAALLIAADNNKAHTHGVTLWR